MSNYSSIFSKMTGSTNTTFIPVGGSPAGRVGFRSLGNEGYRVRVEPFNGSSIDLPSFSSKGSHYSTVVNNVEALAKAVAEATSALTKVAFQIASKQAIVALQAAA